MPSLLSKKERYIPYWLQAVSIIVSLCAVFASIFSGWMSYRASTLAVEISWKINKKNEVENRNFQDKKEVYSELFKLMNDIEYASDISKVWLKLIEFRDKYDDWLWLVWSREVRCMFSWLDLSITKIQVNNWTWDLLRDENHLETKKWEEYNGQSVVWINLLQEQIRMELYNSSENQIDITKIPRRINFNERADFEKYLSEQETYSKCQLNNLKWPIKSCVVPIDPEIKLQERWTQLVQSSFESCSKY